MLLKSLCLLNHTLIRSLSHQALGNMIGRDLLIGGSHLTTSVSRSIIEEGAGEAMITGVSVRRDEDA
jgi:hypothetical protein